MPVARLEGILATAAARVRLLRPQARELEGRSARQPPPPRFDPRATDGTVGVIAEIKRRSPSAGPIKEGLDPVRLARAYEDGGAVAVSVLTEESSFGGSLEDLQRVAQIVSVPVLRKDFILDELQLHEARVAGAAAVLLIARILSAERLQTLFGAAIGLGLGALVEVHSEPEIETALAAGATIIGVNSRDLDDFSIDLAVIERLLPYLPSAVVAVAESGIETRRDVERLAAAGADAVLVGAAVARADDPRAAVATLTGIPCRRRAGA